MGTESTPGQEAVEGGGFITTGKGQLEISKPIWVERIEPHL